MDETRMVRYSHSKTLQGKDTKQWTFGIIFTKYANEQRSIVIRVGLYSWKWIWWIG